MTDSTTYRPTVAPVTGPAAQEAAHGTGTFPDAGAARAAAGNAAGGSSAQDAAHIAAPHDGTAARSEATDTRSSSASAQQPATTKATSAAGTSHAAVHAASDAAGIRRTTEATPHTGAAGHTAALSAQHTAAQHALPRTANSANTSVHSADSSLRPTFGPLHSTAADLPATPPALPWREAAPEELFGSASTLVPPPASIHITTPSLADNAPFQGFVLLLAGLYATLLYRNLGDIRRLADRVTHNATSGRRLPYASGGSGFQTFLNLAAGIAMLFLGVTIAKCADLVLPPALCATLPPPAAAALIPGATLLCALVALLQAGTLRAAGALTLSADLTGQLLQLKRTYLSLAVLLNTPALLLFALCPRGTGSLWFCLLIIGSALTLLLYLRESLQLFMQKKVSILHWFLYLCTVEILPASYLCLLAAR